MISIVIHTISAICSIRRGLYGIDENAIVRFKLYKIGAKYIGSKKTTWNDVCRNPKLKDIVKPSPQHANDEEHTTFLVLHGHEL